VATADSAGAVAARRYAQAAFEIAVESDETRAWELALGAIAGFLSDPQVRQVLDDRRVGQEPKQRLLEAALGDLPKLPLNFARLLVRKNRTGLVGEIEEQFKRMLEEREGIARVTARTAVPMTIGEQEMLAERITRQTGQSVILDTEVDPSILGGVVIQIGDRLIDASTRQRLEELREKLVGSV
jgi:F-type H+-transporting ATPase subunit delta